VLGGSPRRRATGFAWVGRRAAQRVSRVVADFTGWGVVSTGLADVSLAAAVPACGELYVSGRSFVPAPNKFGSLGGSGTVQEKADSDGR